MSIDDILTGELWKRGKGTSFFGRKSWKKRWFALHQTGPGAGSDEPVAYLEYYHGDSAFGHKPVGRYALNGDCGCERLAGPEIKKLGRCDFATEGGVFLKIVDAGGAEPTRFL